MDTDFVIAMAIGLLVFGALYLALDVAFPGRDSSQRRAKAIFAGAGYLLVTLYLWQHPALLHKVAGDLVEELIAVAIALLVLLRLVLRRKG